MRDHQSAAERFLRDAAGADLDPAEFVRLSSLLASVGSSLDGPADSVAAGHLEGVLAALPTSAPPASRRRFIVPAVVVGVGLLGSAAAADVLPVTVQEVVANLADVVGLTVPDGSERGSGADDETSPAPEGEDEPASTGGDHDGRGEPGDHDDDAGNETDDRDDADDENHVEPTSGVDDKDDPADPTDETDEPDGHDSESEEPRDPADVDEAGPDVEGPDDEGRDKDTSPS